VAGGLAVLTCPCHLLITVPLLLALTAGTALGTFLSDNVWAIVAASVLLFAFWVIVAYRWIGEGEKTCALPAKQE
jgi:mercuric ion transport protein